MTAKRLAMWVNANIGPRWIAPKHYLEQFHPKYNKEMARLRDYSMKRPMSSNNPDMPSLTHWMLTKYEAGKAFTAERNPYYYAVDTAGNQLPYIDGEDWIAVADRQVQLLQIRQGTVDHATSTTSPSAISPPCWTPQDAGDYEVVLWDSGSGTGMMYFWNYDYPDTTPKIRRSTICTATRNSSRPCPSPWTAPPSRRRSTTTPASHHRHDEPQGL